MQDAVKIFFMSEIEKPQELTISPPEEARNETYSFFLGGRNAHPEVMKGTSTVIEMKEIKHPFAKGVQARKGIEY